MAPASFDLPEAEILARPVEPKAALAFWQAKIPMTKEQAMALGERERWKAFWVSGLARLDQVQEVHAALGQALKNGETERQFAARISHIIEERGWQGHRVENLFRTNIQTAYAAGRYSQMQAVKAQRPYWQYYTIEDRRTRPSHAVLHGLVYPAAHEFWGRNYPPNGFRCRCGVRTLSAAQVEAQGLSVEKDMPRDSVWTDPKTGMEVHVQMPGADPGFRNNPGKDWMESLLDAGRDKLEKADAPVASAAVRMLAHGGLEQWMQTPSGNFPLAVLTRESAERLGSKATVAVLSAETLTKQKEHHPELTLNDYLRVQDAVEFGEEYPQDAHNVAFVLNEAGGVVVIVKATRKGDELYVTSVRRLSREDAKRERTVEQLKKK